VAADEVKPTAPTSSQVAKSAETNLQPDSAASLDVPTTPQDTSGDPITEAADERPEHAVSGG